MTMDCETTLTASDDGKKAPLSSLKAHRGMMDSFENFLGDFDAMKSRGDINYVLETANRIANNESSDAESDQSSFYEDLYEDSGLHRHKPIDAMHHSGALEKMLFGKSSGSREDEKGHASHKKGGRRPKTTSHSPVSSPEKRESPGMSNTARKSVCSPTGNGSRKTPSSTHGSRESLSRSQHTEALPSSNKAKDELSKSEHRAPRIRRNDLYSSRHRASTTSGNDRIKTKSFCDPRALEDTRTAVRRQRSMRSMNSTGHSASSTQRPRSDRNLKGARSHEKPRVSVTEDALDSAVAQRQSRSSTQTTEEEEKKCRSSSARRPRRQRSSGKSDRDRRRSSSAKGNRPNRHRSVSNHNDDEMDIPTAPNSQRMRRRGSLGAKSNHETSPPSSHRPRRPGSLSGNSDHESTPPKKFRARRRGSLSAKSDHGSPLISQRPKQISKRERSKPSPEAQPATRNFSIVGGEIRNTLQSPNSSSPAKTFKRDESFQSPDKDEMNKMIHDLRRESKRNVMASMKGATRNLMVDM